MSATEVEGDEPGFEMRDDAEERIESHEILECDMRGVFGLLDAGAREAILICCTVCNQREGKK